MNHGQPQYQESSVRLRETTECEDRVIVRLALTTPNLSLSTIQRVTETPVSTKVIDWMTPRKNTRSKLPTSVVLTTPHLPDKHVCKDDGLVRLGISLTGVELLSVLSHALNRVPMTRKSYQETSRKTVGCSPNYLPTHSQIT